MGLCFSKKKPPAAGPNAATSKKPGKIAVVVADDKAKKTAQQSKRSGKSAEGTAAATDKNSDFVVRTMATAASGEEKKKWGTPQEAAEKPLPVMVVPSAPVRTSSCTKEEVDAILIQCGRLSRSSSGTGRAASSETGGERGGHRRRRSGSKRSYDFDQERKATGGGDEQCDWEMRQGVPVSRPSPHRGSPQRKRSGSRERSGGGSRRASRSPGRRADGGASAGSGGGERARQQPGKMVSVPAREKGRAPSPAAASGKRCASPRASSPARTAAGNENAGPTQTAGHTPSLSRSSSRKAEQSPYRRSPMTELDENTLVRGNDTNNVKPQKKPTENAVAAAPQKGTERGKEQASCRSGKEKMGITEDAIVAASEMRAHSSKTMTTTRTVGIVAESLSQRPAGQPGCRSRRASRDFDQNPGSYATQLLEDIQSYYQQHTTTAATTTPSFSLPACVAKACSIVEAVADLNSSSSEPGSSVDDKGSGNAPSGMSDRVVPSAARRNAPPVRELRAEAEPQESAGSNSVYGHPWTPSWEPTSVESTDRTSSTGDEVVEQASSHGAPSPMSHRPWQSKQRPSQPEPSNRSRGGSGNGNSHHRGRSAAHRGSGSVASGRSGVRAVSAAS